MALKSIIYKALLQIADIDRHHYQDYPLVLARHPSEDDTRLMVRLLAFALHAQTDLEFGQGMTSNDEADLWCKDLTGQIKLWIDVGIPDEKLIRKACNRSDKVVIYSYGGSAATNWFNQNSSHFVRQSNLSIYNIPIESTQALAKLAERNMTLQLTVQEDQIWLSNGQVSVQIDRQVYKI